MQKAKAAGTDVYQALLDYRNTPRTATGLSPAEILMNRRTRTATIPANQGPPTKMEKAAKEARTKHQATVKATHDKHAKYLPPLPVGAPVLFTEWRGFREIWSHGHIVKTDGNRSYVVSDDHGTCFRRNRVHIKPDTSRPAGRQEYSDEDDYESDYDEEHTENVAADPDERAAYGHGFVPPARTRSGRAVKPVDRH